MTDAVAAPESKSSDPGPGFETEWLPSTTFTSEDDTTDFPLCLIEILYDSFARVCDIRLVSRARSRMTPGDSEPESGVPRDCRVCKDFFVKISGSVDTGTKVYG